MAEIAEGRLEPGAGSIHFINDLNSEDRETILIQSATSNHPQAHALRAALAQAAAGLDATQYESPFDQLSIRHYLRVELDRLLETVDVWSTVRHYLDEQKEACRSSKSPNRTPSETAGRTESSKRSETEDSRTDSFIDDEALETAGEESADGESDFEYHTDFETETESEDGNLTDFLV